MAKAMRYFVGTMVKETEKAILINYAYATNIADPEAMYTKNVWLPKSQIEVYYQFARGDEATVWKVPLWLCKKNNLVTTQKRIVDEVISSEKKRVA